ncbi:MAG: GtrA family protein [Candidatus Doudnabacteria bacterium]|nr:GtrA family protein [Candidatus Doudnabacteria bacterium]
MENIIQPVSGGFKEKITGFLERKQVIYQFLRFACIGFLNTALNFLVLNTVSKALGIEKGLALGGVAAIAFSLAVVQSYLWNKTWTFGSETGVSLWKNVVRLICVGLLGILTVIIVLAGSRMSAPATFYFWVLVAYLILEGVFWRLFGFHLSDWHHEGHSFVIFFVVTLVGLLINSSLVSLISTHLTLTNTDLDKNIAAVLSTGVSMFWNFTGYKVIVFRK